MLSQAAFRGLPMRRLNLFDRGRGIFEKPIRGERAASPVVCLIDIRLWVCRQRLQNLVAPLLPSFIDQRNPTKFSDDSLALPIAPGCFDTSCLPLLLAQI